MDSVLITGGNKSIGWATARDLLAAGYRVFLGARDLEQGRRAAHRLEALGLENVEAVQLDVTDPNPFAPLGGRSAG